MFDSYRCAAALCLIALCMILLPGGASAQEEAAADPNLYTIDASHSAVGFKVRHFTVSNVRGDFGTLDGSIRYNPEDLADSGVEVVIDAATINTDNQDRDNHLRSADFLDVENHPTIVFKSTKVEKGDDGFMVTGDLTMRGVTKQVSFPFEMSGPIKDPFGMMRLGIEGSLAIDRRDWGLEWNKAMETGGLFVGHQVKIDIGAEAVRKYPPRAAGYRLAAGQSARRILRAGRAACGMA